MGPAGSNRAAGILAGERSGNEQSPIRAVARHRYERGEVTYRTVKFDAISGMAPRGKLVSMKVLDGEGNGEASNIIAALEQIQRINGNGRHIRIHGGNLSVGYDFDPEWFACGQSPLYIEVDRLVRVGVVVVVAAGNTGYRWQQTLARGAVASAQDLTINDPGNAALGITVGSTHRDQPHVYGVSYFSRRGRPAMVARSRISWRRARSSCRAQPARSAPSPRGLRGISTRSRGSGTSMAAPHDLHRQR
jgi:serine protease AprX